MYPKRLENSHTINNQRIEFLSPNITACLKIALFDTMLHNLQHYMYILI